jgi:hypothetical protein
MQLDLVQTYFSTVKVSDLFFPFSIYFITLYRVSTMAQNRDNSLYTDGPGNALVMN